MSCNNQALSLLHSVGVCLFLVSHQHLSAQRETRRRLALRAYVYSIWIAHTRPTRHNMPLMTTFRVAERTNKVQFGLTERCTSKCMLFARVHFLYAFARRTSRFVPSHFPLPRNASCPRPPLITEICVNALGKFATIPQGRAASV